MSSRLVSLVVASAIAAADAGCRPAPSVHELPMSHLSTDLEAESFKSPENRHHMAWRAGETVQDPFVETQQASVSIASQAKVPPHRARLPEAPVTVVPPTPDGVSLGTDPWARFRPAMSATYGERY